MKFQIARALLGSKLVYSCGNNIKNRLHSACFLKTQVRLNIEEMNDSYGGANAKAGEHSGCGCFLPVTDMEKVQCGKKKSMGKLHLTDEVGLKV